MGGTRPSAILRVNSISLPPVYLPVFQHPQIVGACAARLASLVNRGQRQAAESSNRIDGGQGRSGPRICDAFGELRAKELTLSILSGLLEAAGG